MKRNILIALVIALLAGAGSLRADPAKDAIVKEELAKFQGTWQLIAATTDGNKATDENVRQVRVTIIGNKQTVRFRNEVIVRDVSFELDPTKTPKETTDTLSEGPNKGKQIRGIYRLDGDKLVSCVAPLGKERPDEFASLPGSGHSLRVFQRVKP